MILGLDPGKSGGMVLLDANSTIIDRIIFSHNTDHDIADCIREWNENDGLIAYLEQVHSMPRQGVASTFKFGAHFGMLRGMLIMAHIPFRLVTPGMWQRKLGCLSHGNKNVTKSAAQQRWPDLKWTHAFADAALIAEYGRVAEASK